MIKVSDYDKYFVVTFANIKEPEVYDSYFEAVQNQDVYSNIYGCKTKAEAKKKARTFWKENKNLTGYKKLDEKGNVIFNAEANSDYEEKIKILKQFIRTDNDIFI